MARGGLDDSKLQRKIIPSSSPQLLKVLIERGFRKSGVVITNWIRWVVEASSLKITTVGLDILSHSRGDNRPIHGRRSSGSELLQSAPLSLFFLKSSHRFFFAKRALRSLSVRDVGIAWRPVIWSISGIIARLRWYLSESYMARLSERKRAGARGFLPAKRKQAAGHRCKG